MSSVDLHSMTQRWKTLQLHEYGLASTGFMAVWMVKRRLKGS